MSPIVTTVAPTIPVLAAINMPTTVTAMPSPPRAPPMSADRLFSSVSAMWVRCSVTPISTNRGTAISVWFVMIPNTRLGRNPRSPRSNTPNRAPPNANRSATPARVGATA